MVSSHDVSISKQTQSLIVYLMVVLITWYGFRFFVLYLPLLGTSFGATPFELGVLGVIPTLALTIALIPTGIALDRSGRFQSVLLVGALLQVAAYSVASFFQSVILLGIACILEGVGSGMCQSAMITLVSVKASKGKQGRQIGGYMAFTSSGQGLGAAVGGGLIMFYGLQPSYIITAILVGGNFMLILIEGLRRTTLTSTSPSITIKEQEGITHPSTTQSPPVKLHHLYISLGLHTFSFATFYYFLALYTPTIGGTSAITGIADATSWLLGFICSPIAGWLIDRYSAKTILVSGLYLDLLTLVGYLVIRDPLQLLLVQALVGANGAAIFTGALSVSAYHSEIKSQGVKLNSNNVASYLGTALGPLFGGLLLSMHPGDYGLVIVWAIMLMLVANLWCLIGTPSTKKT